MSINLTFDSSSFLMYFFSSHPVLVQLILLTAYIHMFPYKGLRKRIRKSRGEVAVFIIEGSERGRFWQFICYLSKRLSVQSPFLYIVVIYMFNIVVCRALEQIQRVEVQRGYDYCVRSVVKMGFWPASQYVAVICIVFFAKAAEDKDRYGLEEGERVCVACGIFKPVDIIQRILSNMVDFFSVLAFHL